MKFSKAFKYFIDSFKGIKECQGLLWAWTSRIIRARYQQSLLGWLWAFAQPIAQVAIFTFIFTRVVPVDTGSVPYAIFSYVAIGPWSFLAASLTDMGNAIVDNLNIVTKIYFPREILPIAAMLARLMDFLVAYLLVFVMMIWYEIPLNPPRLLLLPVVMAIQMTLMLGLGFISAAANVFVRDVRPILLLILQLWFYLTPIIYPITSIPGTLRGFYSLNPMVGIIEGYRAVWLGTEISLHLMYASALMALILFVLGYWFFKKMEMVFADIA